jgi:hypothetical protein
MCWQVGYLDGMVVARSIYQIGGNTGTQFHGYHPVVPLTCASAGTGPQQCGMLAQNRTCSQIAFLGCDCSSCCNVGATASQPPPPSPPPPLVVASPSPPQAPCGGLDVVLVLDRSASIGRRMWNSNLVPFVRAMAQSLFDPGVAANTRVGVVVYPFADGTQGDTSGGASIVNILTSAPTAIYALTDNPNFQNSRFCVNSPSGTLEFPCSGWNFSPMWQGALCPCSLPQRRTNTRPFKGSASRPAPAVQPALARAAVLTRVHLLCVLWARSQACFAPRRCSSPTGRRRTVASRWSS